MSDLAAAAAAMGVPEALVKRSAEARAKATGATVDEILAAWAGGGEAPSAAPPEPSEVGGSKSQDSAPAAAVDTAGSEPANLRRSSLKPQHLRRPHRSRRSRLLRPAASAAPPILVGERQGVGVVMSGSLGLLVLSLAPLGLPPLACSNRAMESGPPTTRSHQRP